MGAIFQAQLIDLHADLHSVDTVINYIAGLLQNAGVIKPVAEDRLAFIDAVKKREAEISTALGEGCAIPHGKSDAVISPAVVILRLSHPLVWDTEGEVVNYVFCIAVPMSKAKQDHLKILAKLSAAILDDDFRQHLDAAQEPDEVVQLIETFTQE
jgi:fructose-specific phosphotransferase system IIA component